MDYIIKAPEHIMNSKNYYDTISNYNLIKEEPSVRKFLTPKTTRDMWVKSQALDTNSIRGNVLYRLPTERGLMPVFKLLHFEPTERAKVVLDALLFANRHK